MPESHYSCGATNCNYISSSARLQPRAAFSDRRPPDHIGTGLDARGLPHTEGLRTTERYRRHSVGQLQVELTVSDAGTFAKPWTTTHDLQFQPDTEIFEAVCEDKTRWIGRLSEAERDAVPVPASTLKKYVGMYRGLWGERLRTVRVELEGGTLYVNGLLEERVRLIPHSTTSLMGTDGYSFDFDPQGDPAAFMVERHVSGASTRWPSRTHGRSDSAPIEHLTRPARPLARTTRRNATYTQ